MHEADKHCLTSNRMTNDGGKGHVADYIEGRSNWQMNMHEAGFNLDNMSL